MYTERDLLPLSGLQHLVFCERQCALIHVEQAWTENRLTAEGRVLHEAVDTKGPENRGDVRIARGMRIRSLRLGIVGRADVVELHRWREADLPGVIAVPVPSIRGLWQPIPVEYKRGEPKRSECDRVQVCAQAMCLEEMLRVEIAHGVLFYGKRRRRTTVVLTDKLREFTTSTALRFHELVRGARTPRVVRQPKCRNCSLFDVCLPPRRRHRSVWRYLDDTLEATGNAASDTRDQQ